MEASCRSRPHAPRAERSPTPCVTTQADARDLFAGLTIGAFHPMAGGFQAATVAEGLVFAML